MELEACRMERTVRFRVSSSRSGRVLAEVFRDEPRFKDAPDSERERTDSPARGEPNIHVSAAEGARADDSCNEPDDLLLLYASGTNERLFSGKRVTIRSKNGTVRGVRDKVSAGQMLFNTLAKVYGGPLHGNKPKRQ